MKQIVVINNSLKMSKGKIARVCLMLGYKSKKLLNFFNKIKWNSNNRKAIILKSDNYENIKRILKKLNIKFQEHIDAGYTCVPAGSCCGLVCFIDNCDIFNDLKLL